MAFEGADFNWLPTEFSADVLSISGVELMDDQVLGFATGGTVRNEGTARLENVVLSAVHRDGSGGIIGADFTFLESIGPGEEVVFDIANLSGIGLEGVADTEVYHGLIAVPPA